MKEYKNAKFWMRNTDLDKLKGILLRDAQNEHTFTRWAIGEAMENAKRATRPMTRAEKETEEALAEDL